MYLFQRYMAKDWQGSWPCQSLKIIVLLDNWSHCGPVGVWCTKVHTRIWAFKHWRILVLPTYLLLVESFNTSCKTVSLENIHVQQNGTAFFALEIFSVNVIEMNKNYNRQAFCLPWFFCGIQNVCIFSKNTQFYTYRRWICLMWS